MDSDDILLEESFTKDIEQLEYLASGLDKQRQDWSRFCDVTVIVGGQRFPLHRSILTLTCKYFEVMFNSDFQEAAAPEVTIEGSSDAFGKLMDFAYSGNLHVPPDMIVDITQMACYLQFSHALEACANVFKELCRHHKEINLDVVFQMSLFAQNYGLELEPIVEQSVEYLISKFPKFCKTDMFLTDVTANFLEKFLERDDLTALAKGMTEEQVLKAVTDWLKYDWENRKDNAERLLRNIHLGVIPKPKLTKYICTQLQEVPACRDLVESVHSGGNCDDVMISPRGIQVLTRLSTCTKAKAYPLEYWHPVYTKWTKAFPGIDRNPLSQDIPVSLDSVNGQLYAGIRSGDEFRNFVKFDEVTKKWIEIPAIDTPLKGGIVRQLNKYLYIIGGHAYHQGGKFCGRPVSGRQLRRFNTDTEKWEHVPPIPSEEGGFPTSMMPPVAIAYKGCLFVQAYKGNITMSRLYVYNPGQNYWHDCDLTLPIGQEAKFVVDNGRLYRLVFYKLPPNNIGARLDTAVVQELICSGFGNSNFSVTMGDDVKAGHPDGSGAFVSRKAMFAVNDRIFMSLNGHIHKTEYSVEEWSQAGAQANSIVHWDPKKEQATFFCRHTFKKIKV